MIHLTGISKQYGARVLYKDGNFQVRPGDKIGLVGPNGAGKTTIFRVITGEEGIDSGNVNIADRTVIGYFSQDVGEMRGRSALEEVKAGAGKVSQLAIELKKMEKQLEDSAVKYDGFFPGHEPVSAARVGLAYAKSVEGALTGQVICVG